MWTWRGLLAATLSAVVAGPQPVAPRDGSVVAAQGVPDYAGYRALERALLRYRVLAADTTLRPPQRTATAIRPGDEYGDVGSLSRLLVALGDLEPGVADSLVASGRAPAHVTYEGALVEAIARFQRRHGLEADGVIGQATMTQLRVPLARRVRQIELTLERWRSLPARPTDRFIMVNVPAFQLFAFENDSFAERPALTMNVIVGTADGRHHTPLFNAVMREVVFRPYWDVPARIARSELTPLFRRTPAKLAEGQYEIVGRSAGETGATGFPPTPQNLARVSAGELRLRQRPGRSNALGFIKFVLPNPHQVFLHDTPSRELFDRVRRDFSHGCIRVSQPADLALFALAGQAPWNRALIDSMVRGSRTTHVQLARPIPVFVVYHTADVSSEGIVSFYPDLYKRDAALEKALGPGPVQR